jgi:hypothetical protein
VDPPSSDTAGLWRGKDAEDGTVGLTHWADGKSLKLKTQKYTFCVFCAFLRLNLTLSFE